MTTFTLPAPLESEINVIAESEHKPVSTWIAEKLAKVIEDYHDLKAADAAMLDPVTLSEVDAMRMLDDMVN